jgi:LytS/YehU family sensor histidine kinase
VRHPGADPIRVVVSVKETRLLVSVSNPALSQTDVELASGQDSNGSRNGDRFGLRYVRGRMRQFYGDDGRFELVTSEGNAVAILDLPFVRAAR